MFLNRVLHKKTIGDYLGVAMWMMPAPKGSRGANEEGRNQENSQENNQENRNEENQEEDNSQAHTNESEAPAQQGEFEAFEDSPTTPPTTADLQTNAINDVLNGATSLNTTARKGNFGEMVTDRDICIAGIRSPARPGN